jgi:Uma2 family endonuclease
MDTTLGKLTYDFLAALPEDGKLHELIDGEHYVSPSPTLRHQLVLGNLYAVLRAYVRSHDLGLIVFAPFDVLLSRYDVLEPDLLFVAKRRLDVVEERYVHGAPDLAIEILSPSTRRIDLTIKKRTYRRFGVAEYWIVDPKAEAIDVFRGDSDWSAPVAKLAQGDGERGLESPAFPGLQLTWQDVFA